MALRLSEGLREHFRSIPVRSLPQIAAQTLTGYRERPQTDYLMERLTQAMTAAERGEDQRLVVEMPPGQGKSSICSVALPLWALHRHPDWEVLVVSAEASLATKWSRDARRQVADGVIPGVELARDSQAMTEWATSLGGSFVARGVGGQITGRRARLLIIDDPIRNLSDAHSKNYREQLWDTWQSVLKTRLRPGSMVVLVQTRWHTDDLAGRVLARENWEEICFPAIAESNDLLGRAMGAPLLTPQSDEDETHALNRWEQTRVEVGGYIWSALYQQRPVPTGGAILNPDWWRTWTEATRPPDLEGMTVTSWDLTFGSETGDFAVGQVWQHVGADSYLLDQVRGRWPFTEQLRQIEALAARYPQATAHLVEKAANGAAAIDTLKATLPGIVPVSVAGAGSKTVRAQAVAPQIEAGQVWLPETAPWLTDFLAETAGFPSASPHDDQVDALTQALAWLAKRGRVVTSSANPAVSSGQSDPFRGVRF